MNMRQCWKLKRFIQILALTSFEMRKGVTDIWQCLHLNNKKIDFERFSLRVINNQDNEVISYDPKRG